MPVIAIVGAGPGMGRAIAKVFGAQGFKVALISRNPANRQALVDELAGAGIEAAAFSGDITDHASIGNALAAARQRFGTIDVLEFSPANPKLPRAAPSEVTHENAQAQIDFYMHGAIATVRAVLPDMLARGAGTLIFTTGGSSIRPNPMMGNIGPAAAWLRNWAHALHIELAPKGIQVGYVGISAWIGAPGVTAEAIAPLHWALYTERDAMEKEFTPPA